MMGTVAQGGHQWLLKLMRQKEALKQNKTKQAH